MPELLNNPEILRLLELSKNGLLFAVWETLYVTVVATLFAYVIGLPLGVLAVAGEEGGVLPLPRPVMAVINFVINILRSVPFLILMVIVIPLSRLIIGTSIGTVATIIPRSWRRFPSWPGWWRHPSARWTRASSKRPSPWAALPSRSSGRSCCRNPVLL